MLLVVPFTTPGVCMAAGDVAASGISGGARCCWHSLAGGAVVAIAVAVVNAAGASVVAVV